MKLAATVFVTGPDGATHRFGPGDDLPEWVSSVVTNPKAWEEAPEATEVEAAVDESTEPDTEESKDEAPAESDEDGADEPVEAAVDESTEPDTEEEAPATPIRGRGRSKR